MKHEFRNRRRGFTLVELLAVIAIIAVLAALASVAVFAMIGRQKSNNTQATIKVVNKVLQSHWQFVVEEAKKDAQAGLISPAVIAMANPDPTGERAQVLWIKFRLMEAFPQSYAEVGSAAAPPIVYHNSPLTNTPYIPQSQSRYIAAYQKTIPATFGLPSQAQSAACLLMALSVNRGGNVLSQDQIGYAIADTDGDGVKEFVDNWNVPLTFKRFDTSAPNPATAGAKNAVFADPLDPNGMLLTKAWYNSPVVYVAPSTNSRMFYESSFLYGIETTAGSGVANYVIPSITSTGGGGTPIISYQLRQEQPMKHNRLRGGFTLIELLVVMSLIAILATLAIMFFPNAASSQVEARAGQIVQSSLTVAKQRAMRDQAPRGVRFWVNNTSFYAGANLLTNVVTDCQFIEQPPDFPGASSVTIMTGLPPNAIAPYSTNPLSCVMFMPSGQGILVNGAATVKVPNIASEAEFWTVQPGDSLEVLGTGLMHQITQVGIPDNKNNVYPDYVVISPPLPYPIAPTASFRVMRAPRVTGDETLKLPDGTIIDLNTNAAFGNPLPPTNSMENGATAYVDILFSPTGEVISSGVANSNINLWVRSPNLDNPGDPFRGAPTIVSVFTKTGFVGAYPPSSGTPATPYLLIK